MVGWADFKAKATRFLLAHPNYLVLVLLMVGGAGGYYYLGRTGNAVVAVSGLELRLREILESIFLARPRFKEFIIGYPALMVMVYWYRRYRLDLILLVLGFGLGWIVFLVGFCIRHLPGAGHRTQTRGHGRRQSRVDLIGLVYRIQGEELPGLEQQIAFCLGEIVYPDEKFR